MKTWTDPLRLSQGRRLEGGDRKKAPQGNDSQESVDRRSIENGASE